MLGFLAPLVPAAIDWVGGQLSNGGSSGACPGQPPADAVSRMMQNAPPAEFDRLRTAYATANPRHQFPSDPFTLAKHCMGGDDCKIGSTNGAQLNRVFLDLVARYGGNTWGSVQTPPPPEATYPSAQPQTGNGFDWNVQGQVGGVSGQIGTQQQQQQQSPFPWWIIAILVVVGYLGLFMSGRRRR